MGRRDGDPERTEIARPTDSIEDGSITDRHAKPPLDPPTVRLDLPDDPPPRPQVVTVMASNQAQISDIDDAHDDATVGMLRNDMAAVIARGRPEPTDPRTRAPTSPGALVEPTRALPLPPDRSSAPIRPTSYEIGPDTRPPADDGTPVSEPTMTFGGAHPVGPSAPRSRRQMRFGSAPEATVAEIPEPAGREDSLLSRIGMPVGDASSSVDDDDVPEPKSLWPVAVGLTVAAIAVVILTLLYAKLR